VLTWLGATTQFGWHGVAPKIPRELRGPLEYCMACRYLVLGAKARAKEYLQSALEDANANPLLEKLVRTKLANLQPK
jgi:hypothetical protein